MRNHKSLLVGRKCESSHFFGVKESDLFPRGLTLTETNEPEQCGRVAKTPPQILPKSFKQSVCWVLEGFYLSQELNESVIMSYVSQPRVPPNLPTLSYSTTTMITTKLHGLRLILYCYLRQEVYEGLTTGFWITNWTSSLWNFMINW